MTILIMVNYEWFEEWKDTSVRKRGDEYFTYKMRFANYVFDWACTVFPKIRERVGLMARLLVFASLRLWRPGNVSVTCCSAGFPGGGHAAEQRALPGSRAWSHVLC